MHARTLAVGGLRVNLEEAGSGPPVVLLHGLTGSLAYLRPLAEVLARTHRVVALDLPGHGGSDRLAPFSFEAAADHLADAVELLGIERPVVVGHSFGAPLAVVWAAERPVAGIVAASPVGMGRFRLRRARMVLPFHRALAATERYWGAAAASRTVPRRMVFGWFVGMADLAGVDPGLGRTMLRDAAHAAPVVADILPALAALELAPFAARVTAPALVVWGDLDSSGSESGPTLADGLHGRRCVLPGVGHMPMLEAPYAFATALGTFLSATVPA